MAEKRKRPITQAGGLDINDVKKMARAFATNLKKLSKEDLNKIPTSLITGILRPLQDPVSMLKKSVKPTAKSKKGKAFMAGGMAKKKKIMGYAEGGGNMEKPAANQKGLKKLPKAVRNKMGFMNKGGMAKKKAK